MKSTIKIQECCVGFVQGCLRKAGYKIAKLPEFPNISDDDARIHATVKPYTMTSVSRVQALIESVRYIVEEPVDGAIVECGVWKGGSMMAALLALDQLGVTDRSAYLFDTFEGMTEPTREDDSVAWGFYKQYRREDGANDLARCELDSVKANIAQCGYDDAKIHYIKGKVEDTLPEQAPESIALLRLDTDWYASTRHELEHLFPRLAPGGVLIIDDYGAFTGARQAVDEYFAAHRPKHYFLHRIDESGRLVLKV